MTCRNCGKEILDGSVFCPHCGTTQALSPESPRNTTPAWEAPEGGKKKTGLYIGIGAADDMPVDRDKLLLIRGYMSLRRLIEKRRVEAVGHRN